MILPDWAAPARVKSLMTTRAGGVSQAPWAGLNLGDHVDDDPAHVAANRARLRQQLPGEPGWLRQVHSARVVELGREPDPEADAAFTRERGQVCAVLTADCLPVLFCDRAGSVVAAAHAGWRGLAAGVLEASVAALQCEPADILAWLGPAIGPKVFEVGEEVREAFVSDLPVAVTAFVPGQPGKWLADIYELARLRLARVGVRQVHGGGLCTYTDAERFYSFRRDKTTGRMASLIWLAA